MAEEKIDIIICTFNNEKIIGQCLESVKKQTYKKFCCFVVDDNSFDGTVDIIKNNYPWVKIIRKEKNTGPSISRNIGIKATSAEFIVFMDSDVVLEKNWMKKQIKEMEGSAGIIGAKLLYENKTINSAGGSLTRLGFGFDRGRGSKNKYNKKEKVIYVCSAVCIVKRALLEEIGLFDEKYFYPHEDTDLGWRANIAGYDVIFNPDAVALHLEGQTTKTMPRKVAFNVIKNRVRSILKNYEAKNIVKYLPVHSIIISTDIILRGNRTAKIKGILWNIWNISDTLKERRKVQKTRRRKDSEIKKLFDNRLLEIII